MCSHSPTSIIYFDLIIIAPTVSTESITTFSASQSENFDCLGVRQSSTNVSEYLLKKEVLKQIGLLTVDFGSNSATIKMSSTSANNELSNMAISGFAILTSDDD